MAYSWDGGSSLYEQDNDLFDDDEHAIAASLRRRSHHQDCLDRASAKQVRRLLFIHNLTFTKFYKHESDLKATDDATKYSGKALARLVLRSRKRKCRKIHHEDVESYHKQ